MIQVKRAYEAAVPSDGTRVLVDRLWPRGLTKERAALESWPRDVAPSDELRRWYAHDPARYAEFRARYRVELARHPDLVDELATLARAGPLTLLVGARDPDRSNGTVLRELLEERAR